MVMSIIIYKKMKKKKKTVWGEVSNSDIQCPRKVSQGGGRRK